LDDQRAALEHFFNVLSDRGVRISSKEQGERLGQAVADMVKALGGMESLGGVPDAGEPSGSWVAIPAPSLG
jgi:hypothetical protein